jgi:hypothetical protein
MKCFKCNADMTFIDDELVPTNLYEWGLENQIDELIRNGEIDEDEGDLMFSRYLDCEHEISRSVAYVMREVMDDDDRRVMGVQ